MFQLFNYVICFIIKMNELNILICYFNAICGHFYFHLTRNENKVDMTICELYFVLYIHFPNPNFNKVILPLVLFGYRV